MKEIVLNNGNVCLVDTTEFEELSKYKWGSVGTKFMYAARGTKKQGKYTKILMHREITKAKQNEIVDHINGNTLDNRKQNLRLTDRAGNTKNSLKRSDGSSKYKGVRKSYLSKNGPRYSVRIQISKSKRIFVGYFKSEVEAAKAYNEAAIKYFGEFARLNDV